MAAADNKSLFWQQYEAHVRKVIEAMDVLPVSVLLAGKNSLFSCSEDPEFDNARACFDAMRKAILDEKAS